jgi:hypothetical protein
MPVADRKPASIHLTITTCVAALCFGLVSVEPVQAQRRADALSFIQQRDALAAEDVPGRMKLARWAEERQLEHQAMTLYRQVLGTQPDHEKAFDRLHRLYANNRLPIDEDWQQQAAADFEGFKTHATAHFLIIYDTDENWARNRGILLEKAHNVFYSTFIRLGFRPMPLEQRLVCVLYADHADFAAYAKRVDKHDMGWSGGYYSGRTNRIVFFDDRTSPRFRSLKTRIDEIDQQIEGLQAQLDRALRNQEQALVMRLRHLIAERHKQKRWYQNRREAMAQMGDALKTVHEAIHQLAYNSGLQSPQSRYPFWLGEGLATNFETNEPAGPFGPMHGNPQREAGMKQMVADDKLLPLDDFVGLILPPTDDVDELARHYDQAWALFNYLFRYERDELRAYMDQLAATPGERSEAELKAAFVESFGELEPLQERFFRYCRKMR